MTRYTLLALVPTLLLAALVGTATLSPHPLVSNNAFGSDKIQHALGFGSLVVPAALFRPRWLRLVVPLMILAGGAVEILQLQVGRDGEIGDFIADCVGIALALMLCAAIRRAFLRPQMKKAVQPVDRID